MRPLPTHRPLIAPSLLSCDFARIGDEVAALEHAGADLLHVDVMDGRFVPNITIGPPVISAIDSVANIPLDVHLMIVEPDRYLAEFRNAGASILTVHAEACTHLHGTLAAIRKLGMVPGVSINPATPVHVLEEILPLADLVLVMSVNPGFGGQAFIESSVRKVKALRDMCAATGRDDMLIEVDGGVSVENAAALKDAGANVLVSGSALFRSGRYASYIAELRG